MSSPLHLPAGPCSLRPFRGGDEPSVARHANDLEVARNLRDRFPYPYTLEDARTWIGIASTQVPLAHLAIDLGGEAIGGIGLERGSDIHRLSAEVGYWLGRAHWGRGFATAALRTFARWAFEETDLERLFAGVMAWNPASARVLEKAGFQREGVHRSAVLKQGRLLDEWHYARLRERPGSPPEVSS